MRSAELTEAPTEPTEAPTEPSEAPAEPLGAECRASYRRLAKRTCGRLRSGRAVACRCRLASPMPGRRHRAMAGARTWLGSGGGRSAGWLGPVGSDRRHRDRTVGHARRAAAALAPGYGRPAPPAWPDTVPPHP